MASIDSEHFHVGSVSSVYSIRDAIESYRRSQIMCSTARVVSSSSYRGTLHAGDPRPADDEENLITPCPNTRMSQDLLASDPDWDEDELAISAHSSLQQPVHTYNVNVDEAQTTAFGAHMYMPVDERTPLLPSVTDEAPPRPTSPQNSIPTKSSTIGQSTFRQTLFNSTALLLGIGMLSEPLAFSYAGWICGTLLMISYGFITCYTAKYLAGIVVSDPSVRTYADIGTKAFGVRSMPLVSFMFCFETFSVGVVLVTLYADSLNAIIPTVSPTTYKLLGLILVIPTVFVPLSLLSYASLLGIASTALLVIAILVDGLSKFDAPGSLWSPAKTSFGPCSMGELGLAYGLFMAGFGAHSALPSLARDMAEPHLFREVMNYSFGFATTVYTLIGIVGYLMFGNDVESEISQNLLQVSGYNPLLNKLVLWMLVVTPLTKFALSTRPLNLAFETLCGLDTHTSGDGFESQKSRAHKLNHSLKRVLIACERIGFVLLAVTVSILVPDFDSIMAILGSFVVFTLCVVGPIAAKISLERKVTVTDIAILISSTVMALWGTGAAFWSTTRTD